MASSSPNKAFAARNAAILTNGEVAGASFDLNEATDAAVSVDVRNTLGSLTSTTFRFYVSVDNTTFVPLADQAGNVSYVPTTDATRTFVLRAPGWKWLRISAQGAGIPAGSTSTVTLRYLRRGTQR